MVHLEFQSGYDLDPPERQRGKLEAISDFGRLKQLTMRLISAQGWEDLLSDNAEPRNGFNGEG